MIFPRFAALRYAYQPYNQMNTNDSNTAVAPPPKSYSGAVVMPEESNASPRVKEQISQVASDIKVSTTQAIDAAKETGTGYIKEQQSKLAEKFREYGSAVSAASQSMGENGGNLLVKPAEVATRELERAADYLDSADLGTILQDLGNLARKKPELFFGGLFIVGLISVRFLKASTPQPTTPSNHYNPALR